MIESEGYLLNYDRANNRISIILPQTFETLTNTISPVVSRKTHLTTGEELLILQTVKAIMKRKEE